MIFSFLKYKQAYFYSGFIALCSIFSSCDFHSDKVFFVDIAPPDSSGLKLDLTNYKEGDTIRLFTDTKINFGGDTGGKAFWRFMVFMNGNQIGYTISSLSPIPYINFQAKNYSNGIYDLRVVLVARSETGSLADSESLEEITLTRHYVVLVDKTPPLALQVSAKVEDGMLRIKWPQHIRKNFQKYILSKSFSISAGAYNPCWSIDISDQQTTVYSDSIYVGGKVRYVLQVKAADQFSTLTSYDFELNYTPDIQVVWINKNEMKLAWRKNPLFRTLDQYAITLKAGNLALPFNTFSSKDTSAVVANGFLFPGYNYARVEIVPKGKSCPGSNPYQNKLVMIGDPFPSFDENNIKYNTTLDKYFAMRSNNNLTDLLRISSLGAVEQTITLEEYDFTLSSNGQFMYIARNNVLRQFDPLTFNVVRTFDLRNLAAGSPNNYVGGLEVSDDNRISIITNKGNFVLDESFSVIKSSALDMNMTMSPSGNFLFSNKMLWEWNGTAYIMKYNQFPINSYVQFMGDERLIIRSYDNGTLSQLNTTTFIIGNEIALSSSEPLNFDPVSGWASTITGELTAQQLQLNLYDPVNNVVRSFPISWVDTHRGSSTLLINNRLICSSGYSLPLSFYFP